MTDSMHPPANRRCQIYSAEETGDRNLHQCTNEGTHWEKWPGCYCTDSLAHGCDDDFYSWECAGPHVIASRERAA